MKKVKTGLALCFAAVLSGAAHSSAVAGEGSPPTVPVITAVRLLDRPIIAPGMDRRMGANIDGPSLIRVPDWVKGRLGKYYLYFADHKGDYIRLAYADRLAGPWRIHAPGALQLGQSLLPTMPPVAPPAEVARLIEVAGPGFSSGKSAAIPTALQDATLPHLASPDVHVDYVRRKIVMYFHGLTGFARQESRMAVSPDGIYFTGQGATLGRPYMRTFRYGPMYYAIAMPGYLIRAASPLGPFESGPQLFGNDQRHTAVLLRGSTLYVFWTRVGDAPERIYVSAVDLRADWRSWKPGAPREVLRPEREWEGASLPVTPSVRSAINEPVNQIRDPAIFEEGGRVYLLYAVQGERGIGLAEIKGL